MPRFTFHLIPHTHWDREWYLPRGQLGARLVEMIDDLINLLDRSSIPGFLLDGQTILLDDYLDVRREQEDAVRRLVQRGRIETGPWYVLADEQIPSAESLIRNLLLGRADTTRWGRGMPVLYSPDAFGHPAVLPTLAREFGIEHGVAWRGITSEQDLLRWEGPDGQSIVLYHLPPDGYEIGSNLATDQDKLADSWREIRPRLTGRAAGSHVAVFVGADHHHARPDLAQLQRDIARLEPEHEVRLSRLEDFLRLAAETTGLGRRTGELREHGYTWALQGIHGTRAHLKRRNSRVELMLERFAEPLAALAGRQRRRARSSLLEWAWRTLVQCHFHDAIGGCASDAVAREMDVRFTSAEGIGREIVRGSVEDLWGTDPDRARDEPATVTPSLLIWNAAARRREGIVLGLLTVFRRDVLVGPPGSRRPRTGDAIGLFTLESASGETFPVQVLSIEPALERVDAARHYPDQDEVDLIRIAFEAPAIGGLESEIFRLGPGQPVPSWGRTHADGRRLANDRVQLDVADDGSITMVDRASGTTLSGLLRLEVEQDLGDTYSFAPAEPTQLSRALSAKVKTLASGPMVAAMEVWYQVGELEANLLLMLLRDDPVVRCTLRLTNRGSDLRLRARLPTGRIAAMANAGAQMGCLRRAPVKERPQVIETPVATAPAHRFVAVASGVAVYAPGFFEYELEHGGDLLFTVLRAVGQLSRPNLATRPGHAGWPTPTPLAQCQGFEAMDFAFQLGGEELSDPVELQRTWEDLFVPLKAAWFRQWNGSETAPETGIELSGEGLVVSAIKPGRQGGQIVLRCYNLLDQPVDGGWSFGFMANDAVLTRADETPHSRLPVEDSGRRVRFTAAPRGIVTIVISC